MNVKKNKIIKTKIYFIKNSDRVSRSIYMHNIFPKKIYSNMIIKVLCV